jgi:hypothetical protein
MMSELEPDERFVWFGFILLAGDCAHEGNICATENSGFTDDQLADLLKADKALIQRSKKKFVKYDKIIISPTGIITITKWKLYQSEYDRQKSYRVKLQDEVTNCSPSISISNLIFFDLEDKKEWVGIKDEDKEQWKAAYPACDIQVELNRMGEWLKANPDRRKINYRRFINNWLSRSQDRGGTIRSNTSIQATKPDSYEEREAMNAIIKKRYEARKAKECKAETGGEK